MVNVRACLKRTRNRLLIGLARLVLRALPAARRNRPVRRSLWTGAPILTMATNMRAERLLGVAADSLVYRPYFVTDQFTYNLQRLTSLPLVRHLLPGLVLIWACRRYQRFHFYCDGGLLPSDSPFQFSPRELQLLKDLGKEIFFWTYGADVRTREATRALGEPNCCTHCPEPGRACVCDDCRGAENMARLRRFATGVFAMGDMIEYTPGSRNDLFFWPVDLQEDGGRKYEPRYPDENEDKPVRIVHAPNHRHFKGTSYLLEAVRQLEAQGEPVELVLIEKMPNSQALDAYRSADIIFDQCLIGFHGYLAIEGMAMGKPVMCYIRKPDEYLLHPEECPIVNARADQVETVLRELVHDRPRLRQLGIQGRRYVDRHFTLEAFAQRLQRPYEEIGV